MDAKRVNKEYSNAEAVDIIHQVANLYISWIRSHVDAIFPRRSLPS